MNRWTTSKIHWVLSGWVMIETDRLSVCLSVLQCERGCNCFVLCTFIYSDMLHWHVTSRATLWVFNICSSSTYAVQAASRPGIVPRLDRQTVGTVNAIQSIAGGACSLCFDINHSDRLLHVVGIIFAMGPARVASLVARKHTCWLCVCEW